MDLRPARILGWWLPALALLLPAPAHAEPPQSPAPPSRMRLEDRLILVAAIVGSLASVGVGGYVHYRLMRGGSGERR